MSASADPLQQVVPAVPASSGPEVQERAVPTEAECRVCASLGNFALLIWRNGCPHDRRRSAGGNEKADR